MEFLAEIFIDQQPLTIFGKSSITDVWERLHISLKEVHLNTFTERWETIND